MRERMYESAASRR